MKHFLIKFSILFGLIWGTIGYFALFVRPQISGDMGFIGMIPFGQEYDAAINRPYQGRTIRVRTISEGDTINDSIITIGDSFSQFGEYGYNQFLAEQLDCDVVNVHRHPYAPEQLFISLVNNDLIQRGSVVVVESVERSMLGRLYNLDLSDTILLRAEKSTEEPKLSLLDETLIWVRTSLGLKQPIVKFHTDRELFSHPTRHEELYIYNSKWSGDGDILFEEAISNAKLVEQAYRNLYSLHEFADAKGIRLIYLVAADKYDVYEPFITEEHPRNPTLDSLPKEEWVVNSKSILQAAAYDGIKDVYYINNTHWSPKGAEIVGQEVAKRLILVTK